MFSNPVSRVRRIAKATTALAGTLAMSACLGTGDGSFSGSSLGGGLGVTPRTGGGGDTIANYETDPEYQGMGGLSQVGASTYYNGGSNPNGYTGSGVTVAVIDTGIDVDHPEFAGALHPGSRSVVGGSVDDIGAHGTAVAGVVGAARDGNVMHGIAFNSTILALRTDIPGTCPASCLYSQAALQTATDIAVSEGADVINFSLGSFGATSNGWRNSLINAANNGAVIVAAAGNEFNDPDPIIAALAVNPINPAALVATEAALQGPMIAAGAYDTGTNDIANFSNRAGVAQDYYLLAPGVNLVTTDIGGGYSIVSGTSFAAPMIAGAAALLKERFPALTPTQIVDILLVSATDLGAPGTDAIYGRGLMNLTAAAAPLGTLSIPSTTSVDGGGTDPADTVLALGAAFGDALNGSSALASAMFLDGYGRDYAIDLTASIASQSTGPDLIGYLTAGNDGERFETALTEATQIRIRTDESDKQPSRWLGAALDEDPSDASFSLRHQLTEGTDITVAQGQGGGSRFGLNGAGAPIGGGLLGASDMAYFGMADAGGNASVSTLLGDGLQLRVGFGVNEATLGQELETGVDDASVYIAEMSHLADSGLRFGVQFGRLIEEDGLLQAGGDGGFSMNGSATTDFVSAFGVVPLTGTIDLFGSYTAGQSDADSLSTDLIGGFRGVRSEAMSLGIAARDLFAGQDRLSIAVMQPLRVTDGTAKVVTPASRTLEGAVTFQEETVGLAPSGRETDAEITYGFSISPREQIDFSFVTRFEPDHVQDAAPEFSAGLRYRLSF